MRRAVRRHLWSYSVAGGGVICLLVCSAGLVQRSISVAAELDDKNRETLQRIPCHADSSASDAARDCDLAAIENDPAFEAADYVLDRRTNYFVLNRPYWPHFSLNLVDVTFIREFRTPRSESFESGDRWRMYSQVAVSNGRSYEVMVGVAESATWLLTQTTPTPELDEKLRTEAQRIALQLLKERIASRADGWIVADANSGRVREWSGDFPAFYPKDMRVPARVTLHYEDGEIWLVRTASSGGLTAVSLDSISSVLALLILAIFAFISGGYGSYLLANRFVPLGVRGPVSLDEALKTGESDLVEFKVDSDRRDTLLCAISAFANTRGGTLFIGVMDGTLDIVGVRDASGNNRDEYERGLRDSIRQRVQPPPEVVIDYPARNDRVVVRIFVPAGRERHSFDGRYYKREGTQSRYVVDGEINRL